MAGNVVLRGTIWRVVTQIAPLFVNLALTPFVLSTLGKVEYGLWLVASSLTQFIAQFDGGIVRSAQAKFAMFAGRDDRESITRWLVTLLLAVVALTGIMLVPVYFAAGWFADFFHAPAASRDSVIFLVRVLVLLVGLGFMRNLFAAILYSYGRYEITSGTILIGYVVYASGMVWTLSNGMGLRGAAYTFLAQQVVGTFCIVPSAMRYLSRRGIGLEPWREVAAFAAFSWKVQLAGLLSVGAFQGVTLIVGRLAPTQMPDYGPGSTFAQQLRMLPTNALAPIQTALGHVAGAVTADPDAADLSLRKAVASRAFRRMQKQWVVLVTGILCVGAPAAYFGVNTWLPLEGNLAGTVAGLLLIGHLAALLPQVLQQWLMLHERPQAELWSGVANLVVVIGLSLTLTHWMGALGVVVATITANVVALLVMSRIGRRFDSALRMPVADLPWFAAIISAAVSYLCVWGMHELITLGYLPRGGIGLILCGLAAAPALVLFLGLTFGLKGGIKNLIGMVKG